MSVSPFSMGSVMTKRKKPLPTPEELRELLDYDPETGMLTWKRRDVKWFKGRNAHGHMRRWNSQHSGRPALASVHNDGYYWGNILKQMVLAHRAAWAIYTGVWPDDDIDHKNGVRSDNRIKNLRAVTHAVNGRNCAPYRKGVDLPPGVHRMKRNLKNPFIARIRIKQQGVHIGCFPTPEAAHEAYLKKAAELGFSPRHGRKTDS